MRSLLADLRRTALLTLPGVIGLIVTTGILTRRVADLETTEAARFVLFIQIELLCVGLAKLGLEQLVFSRATELADPLGIAYRRVLVRMTLPLAVLLAAGFGAWFGLPLALAMVVAVPLDVFSTVVASHGLACRRYAIPIVNSWVNYPLLLVLLVVPLPGVSTDRLSHVVGLFAATSTLRGLYSLVTFRSLERSAAPLARTTITSRDAVGAGAVSIALTALQKIDSVVLVLGEGRFSTVTVVHVLFVSRLLEASYAFSTVAASLARVSAVTKARWADRTRVVVPAVLWAALWAVAAVALWLLRNRAAPPPISLLALAAAGAAAYLATAQLTMRGLGRGQTSELVRLYSGYVVVAAIIGGAAVSLGAPELVLVPALLTSLVSIARLWRSDQAGSAPAIASRPTPASVGPRR